MTKRTININRHKLTYPQIERVIKVSNFMQKFKSVIWDYRKKYPQSFIPESDLDKMAMELFDYLEPKPRRKLFQRKAQNN